MPTTSDLMGLGLAPALAGRLGNDPSAVTCTGTISTTAAAITTKVSNLTAASSQTGAILPASASLGSSWVVSNTSATGAVVYPPAGCTFNLTGGGTSISVAQYKTVICTRYSSTLWFTNLTA